MIAHLHPLHSSTDRNFNLRLVRQKLAEMRGISEVDLHPIRSVIKDIVDKLIDKEEANGSTQADLAAEAAEGKGKGEKKAEAAKATALKSSSSPKKKEAKKDYITSKEAEELGYSSLDSDDEEQEEGGRSSEESDSNVGSSKKRAKRSKSSEVSTKRKADRPKGSTKRKSRARPKKSEDNEGYDSTATTTSSPAKAELAVDHNLKFTAKNAKEQAEVKSLDAERERLQKLIVGCGVRKQWTRLYQANGCDTDVGGTLLEKVTVLRAQISLLQQILQELGMKSFSHKDAKRIKEERAMKKELEELKSNFGLREDGGSNKPVKTRPAPLDVEEEQKQSPKASKHHAQSKTDNFAKQEDEEEEADSSPVKKHGTTSDPVLKRKRAGRKSLVALSDDDEE